MNSSGQYQNEIPQLPKLSRDRYENIFKLYKATKDPSNSYYFYNILLKVAIPESIDENVLSKITLNRNLAWTTFSYQLYGTIDLWWLLKLLNKPDNIFIAESGVEFKYIKPNLLSDVLNNIAEQIGV